MKTPFLWSKVSESPKLNAASGGEEKPLTASVAEEAKNAIAEFT